MHSTKKVVEITYGSRLYGTATQGSDHDIKGIYLPLAADILLQRVRPVISESHQKVIDKDHIEKDVDFEYYSPEKFLKMLAEGKMVALDMIFAPNTFMLSDPDDVWLEIQDVAKRLINRGADSQLRYCQKQAKTYGVKGLRIASIRHALLMLEKAESQYGGAEKLSVLANEINQLVKDSQYLSVGEIQQPDGSSVPYFEIGGKKVLYTVHIESARVLAQRLLDKYGMRALAAKENKGADWKALSHAVRIGRQAVEFLSTHHITFPRPDAEYLLEIKQGKISLDQIYQEIDALLEAVKIASKDSTLPEFYDEQIIDDFIMKLHRKIVLTEITYD
ncbi:nucleotidyltransferase domain-containing protein [Gammaproteobacteria bacterium]|nr:nucleotidyltransferase domain-containing protein [Gammaproteobacteria bacterium]